MGKERIAGRLLVGKPNILPHVPARYVFEKKGKWRGKKMLICCLVFQLLHRCEPLEKFSCQPSSYVH